MTSFKVENVQPDLLVQEAPESEEEDDTYDEEAISRKGGLTKRSSSKLSATSKAYDVGNKGYLDKHEQMIRKYDTNDDGGLDIHEMKNVVKDLDKEQGQKKLFKKVACFTTVAFILQSLAMFGLIWAALIITKDTKTQDGNLVEASSGNKISTQARGNHVVAYPNGEHTRRHRLLEQQLSEDNDVDKFNEKSRLLNEGVFVATLTESADEFQQIWQDITNGAQTIVTVEDFDGTIHAATVDSGITYTPTGETRRRDLQDSNGNGTTFNLDGTDVTVENDFTYEAVDNCHVWDSIKELGTIEPTYRVVCCGNDPCVVYKNGSENCFSPMSTIVEKSKGRMLIKDLQLGDSVLAANGKYQPFVLSPHSSTSKPTSFVQIHTTEGTSKNGDGAPLEATPDHLVFLYGKDLPIPVGNIKVGDELVGIEGPKTVTKVSRVDRDGFYNTLTADATLFVDGILASSTSLLPSGKVHVPLGPFKVHVYTLARVPVFHILCTKVNSFFCKTQVDDGKGDSRNIMIMTFVRIMTFPRVWQAIIFPSLAAGAVFGIICYYVTLLGMSTLLLLGSVNLITKLKKEKTKLA